MPLILTFGRKREMDLCEFRAYITSYRAAKTSFEELCLKNPNQPNE